jgi:gamma-glutamyltranspeptidase/glutathione hydrolase
MTIQPNVPNPHIKTNSMIAGTLVTTDLKLTGSVNADTVRVLQSLGHTITSDETMGSAQSIMIENGLFLGAADPRRPGAQAIPPERRQPR